MRQEPVGQFEGAHCRNYDAAGSRPFTYQQKNCKELYYTTWHVIQCWVCLCSLKMLREVGCPLCELWIRKSILIR